METGDDINNLFIGGGGYMYIKYIYAREFLSLFL